MCGRFVLRASGSQLAQLFDLPAEPIVVPRYNIAPTQPVGLVRLDPASGERAWALALWGLIPSWAKDPTIGSRMINARGETVTEKPAFRAAFKRRRCLVPADGFYEWQKRGGAKRPFLIGLADGAPFAIAGLWESWQAPDGGSLETCTLITTEANEMMTSLHDRMPVILAPEDYADWLESGEEMRHLSHLRHLLRPFPAPKMRAYPVSTYVNNPRHEGEACIAPDESGDG